MKSICLFKVVASGIGLFALLGVPSAAQAENVGTATQCLFAAPRYDVVWRHVPGSVSERVEFANGLPDFIAKRNALASAGWRVQQLESRAFVCDGRLDNLKVDAVYRYEPNVYEQYALGLNKTAFVAEVNRIWNQGLRIHALDSYYVNGQVYYNAMIRKGTFAEGAFFDLDANALHNKVDEMAAQGWQVNLLDRFNVGNVAHYNVTFRKMLFQNYGVWGLTRNNFESQYSQMRANGWNLYSLSAGGGGNSQTFDAFWTNPGWGESRATRLTASQFASQVGSKSGADVHTFVMVFD